VRRVRVRGWRVQKGRVKGSVGKVEVSRWECEIE